MSADARTIRPRSAFTPSRMARIATIFLSAIALVLGLAPAANAQSGMKTIDGDYDVTLSVNSGQSAPVPGGHLQISLSPRQNKCGWTQLPTVLYRAGIRAPSGWGFITSGGNIENVRNDRNASWWIGDVTNMPTLGLKCESRDSWLRLSIPDTAMGGQQFQFGAELEKNRTSRRWAGANDIIRYTLPAVGTTTQAISVTPSTGRVGENVTLSTRVTASHGSNTPTGTVRFNVDGQTLTANVVNGVATTTTSFATTGSKSVTATYVPANSSQWNGSSRSGTVRIQSEATQTDLALDPVEVLAGGVVRASANVTPAGAEGDIEFTLGDTTTTVPVAADGTASAELNAGSETGEATVTATFVPANPERYTQSSDSQTVDVFEQTTTSTEVTVDADPARIGEETTLTATVSPSGAAGTAEFTIGDQTYPVTVTDGIATLEHTFATVGEHVVVVDFTPTNTDRYTASTGEVTVNVEAETTQTDLTLDPVEVTAGGDVTATAQVTPADADGEVRFDYGELTQTVPVVDGQATATFAPESAGTGTITATFLPADPGRYTESSDTQTVEINAEATQTDLTLDPTDVIEGDTIRASAAVTPAGAQGEVEFTAGDTTVTVPVGTDGVAATDLVASATGEMTVTATFIPTDPGRYAGSSDSQTVNVLEQISTATTLTVGTDPARAGEYTTLTATVTPANVAGTVTFTVEGDEYTAVVENGVATLDHTFTSSGQYPVTADFTPTNTDRYLASTGDATVNVEVEATETSLSLDPVEVTAGGTIQATAAVTPVGAEGTIEFTVGDTTISVPVDADGTATAELPAEAAGQLTVTATFSPTNTERYSESTASQTVEVTAEATQTALTLDPVEVTAGGGVTATASITPTEADGEVRFDYGDQTQTVTVADGQATATFEAPTAGAGTVVATFIPADPGRWTGSEDSQDVEVSVEATQTDLTVGADPARAGEETTLTATVTPGGADGIVEFTIGDQTYPVAVSNGTATLEHVFDATGEHVVVADFAPTNTDRYGASTAQATVNVEVETTQTDLTLNPVEITAGGEMTATAVVTPTNAEGEVEFSVGDQSQTVEVVSGTATAEFTLDAAGEAVVTATFIPADSERFSGSSDEASVTVDAEATSTELTVSADPARAGEETTLTATVAPGDADGTVTFGVNGDEYPVAVVDGVATMAHTFTTSGQYPVTADFTPTNTDRYSGSSAQATVNVEVETTQTDLTLNPVEVTAGGEVTATAQVTPTEADGEVRFDYGDQTQTVTVTNGQATATFRAETAGTSTMVATFTPTDTERFTTSSDEEPVNVEAEQTQTTLSIDPVQVTVGESVTATASVTPAGVAGTVEFTAGDTSVTVRVDDDGAATAELPTTTPGELSITATFTPDDADRYSGSSDTRTVDVEAEVVAEPTSVEVNAGSAEPGQEVTLTATVSPTDAEGQVRFTVDGEEHLVPVVDGVATLVHTAGETGTYTVRAEFLPADPEAYAPSEDTDTLTVSEDDDPGIDPGPGEPTTGSLSVIGVIGSIGIGIHSASSGSLAALGS